MYQLNVMKVSANSMCVRVLMRAGKLDFEEVEVYGQTRSPDYIAKCSAHHAPLLESADLPKGALPDSVAMMQYLCDKHHLDSLYPSDVGRRAMINAAMGFHAGAIYPLVGKTVYPVFKFPPYPADLHGADIPEAIKEQGRVAAQDALGERLDVIRSFFLDTDFIGGDSPSIADLRLASSLEWLPVAKFDFAPWLNHYMRNVEQSLGAAYSEPAKDVRDFVAYTLSQQV